MDDIRNVVFLQIRDATKQDGRACEETLLRTLYREPLGEMVVHYDNVYKTKKGPRKYERTFVRIQDFWSAFLLEVVPATSPQGI